MEFGFEKYAMLIMKNRKRETTEGKEQQNQESIRTFGEKKFQVPGNIGSVYH